MTIESKIKGVKSYSETEYQEYIYNRNIAFCSFDKQKIKKFAKKYNCKLPNDISEFWISIAETVLRLSQEENNEIPPKAVKTANIILDEFNICCEDDYVRDYRQTL